MNDKQTRKLQSMEEINDLGRCLLSFDTDFRGRIKTLVITVVIVAFFCNGVVAIDINQSTIKLASDLFIIMNSICVIVLLLISIPFFFALHTCLLMYEQGLVYVHRDHITVLPRQQILGVEYATSMFQLRIRTSKGIIITNRHLIDSESIKQAIEVMIATKGYTTHRKE